MPFQGLYNFINVAIEKRFTPKKGYSFYSSTSKRFYKSKRLLKGKVLERFIAEVSVTVRAVKVAVLGYKPVQVHGSVPITETVKKKIFEEEILSVSFMGKQSAHLGSGSLTVRLVLSFDSHCYGAI
jgi:hypothetical protein